MASNRLTALKGIDRVIRQHLKRFDQPGVLTVRPGYEISDQQLTGKAAIVVTVHAKKAASDLPRSQLLPNQIEGIPVDVREASAYQRLRAHDPAAAALALAHARPEDSEPTWAYEREMPSGKLLPSAPTTGSTPQPAVDSALAAHAAKQQQKYVPASALLDAVTVTTTITAHVSPDAGLATLQAFLQDTEESLVIGMYDFTSGPILQTFQHVFAGSKTLQMVLDDPALNPTADQSDPQTVDALRKSLGNRAQIAWALDRADPMVTNWMFPYAYHIKVIVRDGSAFWLSSGNLNNSNQPDLSAPPHTEDRDWHVIIEDPGLAQTFAAYLDQDFKSARQYQSGASSEDIAAIAFARSKLALEQNPPPPVPVVALAAQSVPKQVFPNVSVKITPLLTPDRVPGKPDTGQYLSQMMALIGSAQQKLYVQLQYIESSSGKGDYYDELLQAILDRIQHKVDVRLIVSANYAQKWGEKMKSVGVDLTDRIATQPNVHNKGFVIDSKAVVVSSQNFSPAGVHDNRDAGVIIEHAGVAQYFEEVFLADWGIAKPFTKGAAKIKKKASTTGRKSGAGKGNKRGASPRKAPRKKAARKKASRKT
jgi:hypothetical protein